MAGILDKITKILVLILLLFVAYFFLTQFKQNKRIQKKIDAIDSSRIALERRVLEIQATTKIRDSMLIDQQDGYARILIEISKSINKTKLEQKILEDSIRVNRAKLDSIQKTLE